MKTSLQTGLWIMAMATFLSLAPSALAGEAAKEEKTKLKIVTGDAGTVDVELGPMKTGEQRTVKSDQGKDVQITRTEKGYQLDVGGKKIEVALGGEDGTLFRFHGDGGEAEEREVRIVHQGKGEKVENRELVIVTDGGDDDEDFSQLLSGGDGQVVIIKKRKGEGAGAQERQIEVRVVTGDDKKDDGKKKDEASHH